MQKAAEKWRVEPRPDTGTSNALLSRMIKRGRRQLGIASLILAGIASASLAACSSDDGGLAGDGGASGLGGSSGANAGRAGATPLGGRGGASGGSVGGDETGGSNLGGGTTGGSGSGGSAGSGGMIAVGGMSHGAGAGGDAMGGESPGGAAGGDSEAAGMGGEAGSGPPVLTPSALVKALSPLPALPPDTTNQFADNAAAATLGQKLFFDKRYSGPLKASGPLGAVGDTGKVSCFTCHAGPAMSDNRAPFNVTLGTDFHTRNAPALVNSSFYRWTNWGGRFAAQWELPLAVAENGLTMNSTRLKLAHFIYDHYKAEYEAVFGALEPALSATATDKARFPEFGKPGDASNWDGMVPADQAIVNRIIVNFGKALQAYLRKLVSRDAPFDQYVANNGGTLSDSAKRGAELFVGKAKCSKCHSGPLLSDQAFHNLGVAQPGTDHVPAVDNGRFSDGAALLGSALNVKGVFSDDVSAGTQQLAGLSSPLPDATKAAFRTASLREVKDTGPYMHSGQLQTLAEVVQFYVNGGGTAASGTIKDPLLTPVALEAAEQLDLVHFLESLSGASLPPALLVDTSGQ